MDENVPRMTVERMQELGHDVVDLRGTEREGLPDDQVWQVAKSEKRLLITTDKGFLRRRRDVHSGLLVVALRKPNRLRIHERIMQVLSRFREGEWEGMSVVVRDTVQSIWKG